MNISVYKISYFYSNLKIYYLYTISYYADYLNTIYFLCAFIRLSYTKIYKLLYQDAAIIFSEKCRVIFGFISF